MINQIPFGMAVEVDKGFLIENLCAKNGVCCIQPMKKLKTQTQQLKEDTGLTQKIRNTRIIIEQVNGQLSDEHAAICHSFFVIVSATNLIHCTTHRQRCHHVASMELCQSPSLHWLLFSFRVHSCCKTSNLVLFRV